MSESQNLPAESRQDPGSEVASRYPAGTPILEPHHLRQTDIDPKAARRAERQVSLMFLGSALFTILFVIAFVQIPATAVMTVPFMNWSTNASNVALGLTFGLAIFLIGAGAIHWAKKLMPGEEIIQDRHPIGSSAEDTADAEEVFWEGANASGFPQRRIVRRSLLLAMGLFPIPMIVVLRDLNPGPMDFSILKETLWRTGSHIVVDPTGRKIRPTDIPVGGLVSAMPEDLPEVQHEEGNLNARAKAAIILVRMTPEEIVSQQGGSPDQPWDYQGVLAFSKICTHVGCPIALYQQRTHHLICPCHQSTFDLSDSGNVVFGPAARQLPQLPITVDEEGYLIARSDFQQPVGPSFWERDR